MVVTSIFTAKFKPLPAQEKERYLNHQPFLNLQEKHVIHIRSVRPPEPAPLRAPRDISSSPPPLRCAPASGAGLPPHAPADLLFVSSAPLVPFPRLGRAALAAPPRSLVPSLPSSPGTFVVRSSPAPNLRQVAQCFLSRLPDRRSPVSFVFSAVVGSRNDKS